MGRIATDAMAAKHRGGRTHAAACGPAGRCAPPKPVTKKDPDSLLPPPPKVKPAFVDTCRAGMTCIEDYSDSTMRGMTRFYQALDELAKAPHSGSYCLFQQLLIEADILTADLREMLQQKYGGCGVGFVTITSMTSGFRPTVRHSFSG